MGASPGPTPAPVVIHQNRPRQQQGGQQQGGQQQGGQQQGGQQQGGQQQGGQQQGGQQQGGQQSQSSSQGSSSGSNSQSSSQASPGSTAQSPSSTLPNIPQTAPAGGVEFTQPAQTAAPSFYKIAQNNLITFGWNYTSLSITPSQITVSAFCSENGNTYPVGPTDGVIPGTATQVVWDPFSYDQAHPTQPLIVGSYTLQIQDAHGLTALPAPGRFTPNQQLKFALYLPQPYTPLASWSCSGCSAAARTASTHPVFVSLFATLLVMMMGGWGVLRRR